MCILVTCSIKERTILLFIWILAVRAVLYFIQPHSPIIAVCYFHPSYIITFGSSGSFPFSFFQLDCTLLIHVLTCRTQYSVSLYACWSVSFSPDSSFLILPLLTAPQTSPPPYYFYSFYTLLEFLLHMPFMYSIFCITFSYIFFCIPGDMLIS